MIINKSYDHAGNLEGKVAVEEKAEILCRKKYCAEKMWVTEVTSKVTTVHCSIFIQDSLVRIRQRSMACIMIHKGPLLRYGIWLGCGIIFSSVV